MQTLGASIFIKKYKHYLFFATIFLFLWLILRTNTREYLSSQEKKYKNSFKSAENIIKTGMKNYKKTGKKFSEKDMRKFENIYGGLMRDGIEYKIKSKGINSKEYRFLQGQLNNLGKKYPDLEKLFSRPIDFSKLNQFGNVLL